MGSLWDLYRWSRQFGGTEGSVQDSKMEPGQEAEAHMGARVGAGACQQGSIHLQLALDLGLILPLPEQKDPGEAFELIWVSQDISPW